mgnify:CR=1 FL=1
MRVCGMDEVGRGALAGSLMAAALVFNVPYFAKATQGKQKLKDSKKLSRKQRDKIYKELLEAEVEFVVEEISVEEINQFGIGWANVEIFRRLKNKISADKYIADGLLKIDGVFSEVRADNKYPEVMAASIIAKVTRDNHMIKLHDEHVMYGWDTNVGYGTRKHIEAIRKHGVTKHHRKMFVETALKKF